MHLVYVCEDSFLLCPKMFYFAYKGLKKLVILSVDFSDFHFDFSLEKAQLLHGWYLSDLIILLKLPLHLFVIFKREEVLHNPRVPEFIMLQDILKEIIQVLLLFGNILMAYFRLQPAKFLQVWKPHTRIHVFKVLL